MQRRRFLKLVGIASLAAGFQVVVSTGSPRTAAAASRGGKLYRGDRQGKIYSSRDKGVSWQLHTYLGPRYSVNRMATVRGGGVTAAIGFQGRQFYLKLAADEKTWRTA